MVLCLIWTINVLLGFVVCSIDHYFWLVGILGGFQFMEMLLQKQFCTEIDFYCCFKGFLAIHISQDLHLILICHNLGIVRYFFPLKIIQQCVVLVTVVLGLWMLILIVCYLYRYPQFNLWLGEQEDAGWWEWYHNWKMGIFTWKI